MGLLPPIRRLVVEDFPEQKWIGKLLSPINEFMESVYRNLNRQLTLRENVASDFHTAEVDGTYPLALAWTLKARPISVHVGNTVRSDGASFTITAAVGIRWSFNQSGQLQIDQVVGVTPTSSAKFKLTLLSFTG